MGVAEGRPGDRGVEPPGCLSGGKARSQSIGMARGIGLVEAIPSVATRLESLRNRLLDSVEFLALLLKALE